MSTSSAPQKIPGLRDYFTSALYLVFFMVALLVFDPIQRVLDCLGRRFQQKGIIFLSRVLIGGLKICGVNFEYTSADSPLVNLPLNRPLVIVSNHQSLFDILSLSILFAAHLPRFISKQELGRGIPTVSFNLRYGGSALIDRKNRRQALAEIANLAERLNAGKFAVVIFPEGTRAKDGVLKPFKISGPTTLLSAVPEALIVPVAIDGSWIIAKHKMMWPIPYGTKVTLRVGPAIEPGQDPIAAIKKAEAYVRDELARSRGVPQELAIASSS